MHSCDFMVCLLSNKLWVMVPSPLRNHWALFETTTISSDQSHESRNLKNAGLGKCTWVYATEKRAPGNHHDKGWNTSRLPVPKGSSGWRKSPLSVDFKCHKQRYATPGRTNLRRILLKTKSQNSTPVVIKEVMRVKILQKKKAI